MLPIDVASLLAVGIINTHPAGVFTLGRPYATATLGPCLEVEEQALLIEFLVLVRHGTETGPDTNHEMGVQPVHLVYHLSAIREIL